LRIKFILANSLIIKKLLDFIFFAHKNILIFILIIKDNYLYLQVLTVKTGTKVMIFIDLTIGYLLIKNRI